MKQSTLITNGRVVMPDRIVSAGEVYIEDGVIRYAGKQGVHHGSVARRQIDAEGGYILPGLIDEHSDAIEKEIEPRPGAFISTDLAFRELEKKVAGHGITTMYHSFSFAGAAWGLREDQAAAEVIRTMARMAQHSSLIRNRMHLRFEITDLDGISLARSLMEEGIVDLLSFMDHTPGQGQYPTIHDFINYMEKTYHRPLKDIEKIIELRNQGGMLADETVRILSEVALRQGVPMASHDDDYPARVTYYRERGVSIHEFPINMETAAAARQVGNHVCVGAPNILRGGSTGKGLRAIDAVVAGLVDMICSDYYPPSILHAVFKLAEEALTLHEAVALASSKPALSLGINAGSLIEGKLGDVIVVRMDGRLPVVMHTIVAGIPVYGINYRIQRMMPDGEEQFA